MLIIDISVYLGKKSFVGYSQFLSANFTNKVYSNRLKFFELKPCSETLTTEYL